jgi:putative ABC transport system permease protein
VKLSNVAGLYVRRLRGRVGQELLALVGIAVGVSLLFAALVANSSLTGSFERLTDGVVGDARFQVTARSSATLGEDLLAEAQRLAGVETAAATLEVRVEAEGTKARRSLLLTGVTPEFAKLGGAFAEDFSYGFLADVRAMALPTPLVDQLGVSLGQMVALKLGGRTMQARLGAKLQGSDIGGLLNSPIAIAPLRYVQELSGQPGRVSRIFVVPDPGQAAQVQAGLRRLAGARADVRPANFDAALFREASLPTSQSTAMFSVFGAMVGFLFAFSAMLLTVPQRRRLIADLDTEGYGTATILKILLFDALVLGVVASALGIVIGDQVARNLFDETPDFLQYAFAVGPERIVTVSNVLLAAAGGIVASCVAVLGPTLPALRDTHDDDREHGPARRRTPINLPVLGGIALLAAGVAIAIVAPASAALGISGLVALTVSMLLLLPSLLRLLVDLLAVATREIRSVVPFLAIFDLRDPTAHVRSLAVAATGAVAVFGSVALQGAHADLLRGLDRTSQDVAALGDVWALAPGDANLLVTTPFREPDVRPGNGIERIDVYRGGFLDLGDHRVRVFAPPADRPRLLSDSQLITSDPATVAKRLAQGGWIVVSDAIARERGLHEGDRFTLPSPVPTTLRVAALSTNMGWPPGAIVLNADDFARAWGSDDVTAILATLAPGTSPGDGRRALTDALGSSTDLAVYTASQREHDQDEAARAGVARLAQIATLVLISAVIAMAAAMAGLIWQRRLFLAGVKIEGYSTSELWRALLLEAAVLIGAGCAIGATFGLLGQGLLSRALTSVTGFPVIYRFAAAGAILTCLAVTVAAVVIVGLLGQRAASVAPEAGLGE